MNISIGRFIEEDRMIFLVSVLKLIVCRGCVIMTGMEKQVPKSNALLNLGIGAAIQTFEVSTLGQPFEVVKTHMAGIVGYP